MASYHLARYHEQDGNIREAIIHYGKSLRLHHAIGLAKEAGLDPQVYEMALQSTSNQIKLQAARYFESKGKMDKAVDLYDDGGNLNKAMKLAQKIGYKKTFKINTDSSADSMEDRIPMLIENQQYEQAVEVLFKLKKYDQVLKVCEEYSIGLTEEMAETMKPADASTPAAKEMFKRIAKICKKGGEYKAAAKMYVQSGDKLKAMKAIIKSGDIEQIKSYATASR